MQGEKGRGKRQDYDVIVIGARCAGSPLASLLARKGYRVLVVDKATFPSDTISTHMILPPGGAALHRWGIWDKVAAANPALCHTAVSNFPGGELNGPWHAVEGVDYTVNVRRFKLDAILVDVAREAGVEVREGVTVQELLFEDGRVVGISARESNKGSSFRERARIVVGADGRNSFVAKTVGAPSYNSVPSLTASYFTYVADMDKDRDVDELFTRPPREYLFIPTDDDLTLVNLVISRPLLSEFRKDVEKNFLAAFDMEPELSARLRAARRVCDVRGATHLPNFYRKPYGAGWALVGDAGFTKDPIRAQGMSDAFLDAEFLAGALDAGLSGAQELESALQAYEHARNVRTAFQYQMCIKAALFEDMPAFGNEFLRLINNNRAAVAQIRGLLAGSVRPEEFFNAERLTELLAGRGDRNENVCEAGR